MRRTELHNPGPITVRDIAERTGVSIGTVSRALKNQPGVGDETRHRILQIAERMGYNLGNLRPAKLKRISFLHRAHFAPSANPFYSPVLHGVEEACRQNDLVLSFGLITLEQPVAELVRRHEADAILCVSYFEPEVLASIQSSGVPVALIDHFAADLPAVNTDNFDGAYQATQHLVAQGRRRIAFIAGPEHYSIRERRRAYRKAMYDAGIAADPDLDVTREPAEAVEGTVPAMERLLALPEPPDAIFTFNDDTALAVLRYLREHGIRVPEQIAVVGYDDIYAARHSHPSLTTVRVDKEELGRKGVELLLEGGPMHNVIVPNRLVVRKSTTPKGRN
ncbi:MAG: LacI family DNA-binding transcriptional regulator [Meiothermus sp.]|nr:LacI family DNA-binding transcriptional regulator [Meiothermus sp.]